MLILTRANTSRLSGQWSGDDYDVLENGVPVGRIFLVPTGPEEGIVSKRLGLRYVSGRSSDWLKMKNPAAPAVKREAEEGLGAMSKRKLKPWMRVEQAIIWSAGVIASLMVAAGIAYRAFF